MQLESERERSINTFLKLLFVKSGNDIRKNFEKKEMETIELYRFDEIILGWQVRIRFRKKMIRVLFG